MPLYSDHYYYGGSQPSYYTSSSPYATAPSRISSPYSFPYMSPISALLSAGIGANPMPRGLRSYSPMLSAISETGSPLMSRRDIGNHRSSPRHLGAKNYYRQRPIVIDTDNLDLSKRRKEETEEVESTPGMISRAKTIVRMHTRKLKENPELKKKKTQAEILMEKYFIKEKPVKEEEEVPRRKRIWEQREEELNRTPVRSGTIKRTNTVHKRLPSPAPVDESDVLDTPSETIPIRKMSIDSELLKEEEALLDCMIQEELGLSNLKEMKKGSQNTGDLSGEEAPDRSTVKRKSKNKRDQIPYGRRKSSLDTTLDECGVEVSKRKSHKHKKKTSKTLPLDEANSSECHSGSDSSSKDIKDEAKVGKRRSTKKKKPPKFKIDSLHVEEKSSPKLLRKFQYEVIVEENKNSDSGSVKTKSVKHINKEDIPKVEQQRLLKVDTIPRGDNLNNTNIDKKSHLAGAKSSSGVCDSECDTLTNNKVRKQEISTNEANNVKEVRSVVDCKAKIDNTVKKTKKLVSQVAVEEVSDGSNKGEQVNKTLNQDQMNIQKTSDSNIITSSNKNKPKDSFQLTSNKEPNNTKEDIMDINDKKCQSGVGVEDCVMNFEGTALENSKLPLMLKNNKISDNEKGQTVEKSGGKFLTTKQKSLTPDLGRKVIANTAPKSEPNTPIMAKKQVLPKGDHNTKLNKTQADFSSSNTTTSDKFKSDQSKTNKLDSIPFSSSSTITSSEKIKSDKSETNILKSSDVPVSQKQVEGKSNVTKTVGKTTNEMDSKALIIHDAGVKNMKGEIQGTSGVTVDKIVKDESSSQKTINENKNQGLLSLNKAEKSPQIVEKTKNETGSSMSKEAVSDKISHVCNENNKTLVYQKGLTDKTAIAKSKQTTVKLADNVESLQKITPSDSSSIIKLSKEEIEVDCNSNNVSKAQTENRTGVMKKEVISSKEKITQKEGTTSSISIQPTNDKPKEFKSSSNIETDLGKNKKIESTEIAIENKVTYKNPLETNKTKIKLETTTINNEDKFKGVKKDTDKKSGKNSEISDIKKVDMGSKSLESAVKEKNDINKGKTAPSKSDERTSVETKITGENLKLNSIDNLHSEVFDKTKKENLVSKITASKANECEEVLSAKLVENVKQTNKLVATPKKEGISKTKCEVSDPSSVIKNTTVQKSEDNKDGTISGKEAKLPDTKQIPKGMKEPKQDKIVKSDEVKGKLETKSKSNTPEVDKIPKPLSKPQEKINVKEKVIETAIDSSNKLDQKTVKPNKSTELSSEVERVVETKTNVIDASKMPNLGSKENTVGVNTEKKKRIKSESDVLDNECSEANGSCKEPESALKEKSKSLKEISSKKKKRSKDKNSGKNSGKKSKNPKSPRKIKESPKSANNKIVDQHSALLGSEVKTKTVEKTTATTETLTTSVNTTSTTADKTEGTENTNELSKRSTRLLHFINKCMRLSEDDDNIFIEYSDEDESSSSEETSDSEYTSDSEEDTLTDDSSDECDVNCHRKCEKLMPNLCGVNQKLIVEALSSLRKGSSESRDHGSPTRRHSNAALSLEEESRHGRVTPPATTIPKFRKYTMDDFQFLKVLGKGSFGKVLLAELRGTQYYYAVKCLKKDVVLEDDDVECTLIERKVLALGTNHPYLCHLFCTFQTESHLFFVMEYLNGGDLMFHIQQQGRFDEGRARFYAAEIVSGLKFLHKKGIVYRDLKLDNILLDFDGHVRIADFGMCKLQIYLDRTADTFCGTPDYMAPEIIKGLKYNQCVDWWSFGILMYEMLVGQSPFSGCDEDDLFWCICNRQPHYPRFITLEAKRILMQLLEKEASKRLGSCENGALEVMAHPFFNGLDWDRLERRELMPPFKPNVKHPLDVHYFDKHFTAERACLTPIDPSILQSMDQTQFQGFSYTNPNVTD